MVVDGLELRADRSPQSYVGTSIRIEGVSQRIGSLLAVGSEKFIYELDENRVLKIYRDFAGASWEKDKMAAEIFQELAQEGVMGRALRTEFGLVLERGWIRGYVAVQE